MNFPRRATWASCPLSPCTLFSSPVWLLCTAPFFHVERIRNLEARKERTLNTLDSPYQGLNFHLCSNMGGYNISINFFVRFALRDYMRKGHYWRELRCDVYSCAIREDTRSRGQSFLQTLKTSAVIQWTWYTTFEDDLLGGMKWFKSMRPWNMLTMDASFKCSLGFYHTLVGAQTSRPLALWV